MERLTCDRLLTSSAFSEDFWLSTFTRSSKFDTFTVNKLDQLTFIIRQDWNSKANETIHVVDDDNCRPCLNVLSDDLLRTDLSILESWECSLQQPSSNWLESFYRLDGSRVRNEWEWSFTKLPIMSSFSSVEPVNVLRLSYKWFHRVVLSSKRSNAKIYERDKFGKNAKTLKS